MTAIQDSSLRKQLPDWLFVSDADPASQSLDRACRELDSLAGIVHPMTFSPSFSILPSSVSKDSESLLDKIAKVELSAFQQPLEHVLFSRNESALRRTCEVTNAVLTPCRNAVNAAVEAISVPVCKVAAATKSVVRKACSHRSLNPVCRAAKNGAEHVAEILHVNDALLAVSRCSAKVKSFSLDYLERQGIPPEIALETFDNLVMVGAVAPFCRFSKTIPKTAQVAESSFQIPKSMPIVSSDFIKNHPSPQIRKERGLMWEDLGTSSPVDLEGMLGIKRFDAYLNIIGKYRLHGMIGFESHNLVVTVDLIIAKNLDFFNGISCLKELALHNRAKALQIKAWVTNERLRDLMNRRFGHPRKELVYYVWQVPLNQ